MFYFILEPIMMYNWILILAAVIPAVFLMIKVYRADRMEKESGYLLRQLVIAGILSTIIALIEEKIGEWILSCFVPENTLLYQIILYFVIVAIAEESSKYFFLKKRTWNNPEFNCQYDGVVYAVFVSLGFALWENINYVLSYGFSTAIVRAITAIQDMPVLVYLWVYSMVSQENSIIVEKSLAPRYSEYSVLCYQFYYMAHMIL